ncbi:MAG TPA: cytochrome c3 family protein, partial [Candidatus Paceibacterota bacterium]|nr:cytochrome c3 family protein [Candidatus Paceibacterota bacterium]
LPNPWPHTDQKSVSANACENCHSPHSAGGKQRLLNYQAEEQNCFPCHNGNVAKKNIQSEFNKPSVHPVIATTLVHDPAEVSLVSAGPNRHVECADCHNSHVANSTGKTTPTSVSGALNGVRGINTSGANVQQISYEYELCFRCHADTAKGPAKVSRQYPQLNTRLEFQDVNGQNSFHPIISPGRNPLVPSLKAPWTTASMMTCGDCHNNDSGPGTGGTGTAGPHGSAYAPLLERQLSYADSAATSANSALCYKCHNFVDTAWRDHTRHIGYTACGTCHDPHGSPNAHLINFDPTVVSGARTYKAGAIGRGNCTLSCHGKDHNNASY